MSIFKRPAWAKTQVTTQDDTDDNIFSHSSRSYQQIVAEELRKKNRKAKTLGPGEQSKERKSPASRDIKEEVQNGSSSKRRRITLEESSALLKEVGLPPTISSDAEDDDDDEPDIVREEAVDHTPQRRSRRTNKGAAGMGDKGHDSESQRQAPPVIDIEGSDDEHDPSIPQQAPTSDEDDESDDELADLRKQARIQRSLGLKGKRSQTPDLASKSPAPSIDTRPIGLPTPPLSDPTVQLFVSSPIPGTKPLIVHRKLSQNLRQIRTVWCSKQVFPAGVNADDVFLIYRMRKVYDATTCRTLGIEPGVPGVEDMDGTEKVHLQAVTEALFVQLKAEKASEDRRRQGLSITQEDHQIDAPVTEPEHAPKDETLIRLVLKAKGKDDFRLKVKPNTLVAKIVKACRGTFRVPDDQPVFLDFDGEHLDESAEVQSTELSDMDCVDVHIG